MKSRITVVVLLLAVALSTIFLPIDLQSTRIADASTIQKNRADRSQISWDELDVNARLLVGKRVFYRPTAEERIGINSAQPESEKYIAFVTRVQIGERNGNGQLVADLKIFRPGSLGGEFDKENVPFGSDRTDGTFDHLKPGDLVN